MTDTNHTAWAKNMVLFIRERGLEREFRDWSGGWPCPVVSAESPSGVPFTERELVALEERFKNASDAASTRSDYARQFGCDPRPDGHACFFLGKIADAIRTLLDDEAAS